ncbi:MAG: hypothetical protein O7A03_09470 [Alphaproteobacteria bacterium]|nr:hypothetical protein [Alphaproteobacteria bacterium]
MPGFERWSMDFQNDMLATRQRFGILNIVDDFSWECLTIEKRLLLLPSWPSAGARH